MPKTDLHLSADPLWYKDAVIYELQVKSFYDSNGDGMGDLRGVAQKLDYLHRLGVTAIWLLPFYPSPLRDDGYDIADYFHVHPQYGTIADFKYLLREAHSRGIRIITELVMNHTSDQHEWFQKSRRAKPGSHWRNFYVWSDTPERYKDARIIFKDFETSNWTWDPVANQYYWHRFYSHQPDLNFDNPAVVKAMFKVLDYWFEMGVDGMRLDAVPYLFEREGSNCENLPETYEFLRQLRAHLDSKFTGKMLLAEANQWPEDAVAYFGNGDRCHMAFHFPLMPRIFMGSWMEDRFPIIDIFDQTPAIPDTCQWALFLRNHDELTLEMVSDEERDYMYRVYANDPSARINLGIRRRLAPLLTNNRRKIELLNILLLSLPGTPVIYYGDEIGMGDNHYLGDRNGVRTPMQWSSDRNAGFSIANPQRLFLPIIIDPDYHYETINVDNEERNQSSLLWWMRRMIAMRKRHKAFGRGKIEFLQADNPKVLVFLREYQEERILVIVNLSRFAQVVEFDSGKFVGAALEETASGNRFPPIKDNRYTLTLGPYDYFWLSVVAQPAAAAVKTAAELPELAGAPDFGSLLAGNALEQLEREILPAYMENMSWFCGGRKHTIRAKIFDVIPVTENSILTLLDVIYRDGMAEKYVLPLSIATGDGVNALREMPQAQLARLNTGDGEAVLYDASYNDEFRKRLLTLLARRHQLRGDVGRIVPVAGNYFRGKKLTDLPFGIPATVRGDHSNTLISYDNQLLLKLFRRVDEGPNPDVEIDQALSEHSDFDRLPGFAGSLEYRRAGAEPISLALMQKYVPYETDGLEYIRGQLGHFIEKVQAKVHEVKELPKMPSTYLDLAGAEIPPLMHELAGASLFEMIGMIGRRTAEMHLGLLARGLEDPRFSPEPFSLLYQRSLYHGLRTQVRRALETLRKCLSSLEADGRAEAEKLISCEPQVIAMLSRLYSKKISVAKLRIHGDYRLGQLLFTGNDFMIVDFEGEPELTVTERRLKRSPLRDVAGMLHSMYTASYASAAQTHTIAEHDRQLLQPWLLLWVKCAAGTFLRTYLNRCGPAPFLPTDPADLTLLLQVFQLDKAFHSLTADLSNHPERAMSPLTEIRGLIAL